MKSLGNGNYLVRPYKVYKKHTYTLTYPDASDAEGRLSVDEASPPPDTWIWEGDLEPVNSSGISQRTLYRSIRSRYYPSTAISMSNAVDGNSRLFDPTGSFYVIGLSHFAIGEGIKPGTFKLRINGSEEYVTDDSRGRLFVSNNPSVTVGNIFYGVGIAVINKDDSFTGGGGGGD